MATTINFPDAPTSGQTYTYSGTTYYWNGIYWSVYNPLEPSVVSDTAPTGTTRNGFFWLNPVEGTIFAYYNGVWVQFIKDGKDGVIPTNISGSTLNISGNSTLNNLNVSGTSNFGISNLGNSTITGTTTIQQVLEKAVINTTALSGAITFDALTQGVIYFSSSSAGNWTLNIRGNSGTSLNTLMSVGQSLTIAILATQGATPYYCTAITIDGGAITPKWQGGSAPTGGNASSIDIYSYTIIKTAASTYSVFASQTKFA